MLHCTRKPACRYGGCVVVVVGGLQYKCVHAQARHVQINMYDSTAVGFLLCMLMISFKFNNAT